MSLQIFNLNNPSTLKLPPLDHNQKQSATHNKKLNDHLAQVFGSVNKATSKISNDPAASDYIKFIKGIQEKAQLKLVTKELEAEQYEPPKPPKPPKMRRVVIPEGFKTEQSVSD